MSSMEKSYFIPLSPTERYASICKITHAKCSWFRKISFKKIVYSHSICKATTQPLNLEHTRSESKWSWMDIQVFEKIHEYLLGLYHMHNRMYPRRGEHSAGRSDTSRQKTRAPESASFCLLAFLIPVRESNGEWSDCIFLSIKLISSDDGKKHWHWHARLHKPSSWRRSSEHEGTWTVEGLASGSDFIDVIEKLQAKVQWHHIRLAIARSNGVTEESSIWKRESLVFTRWINSQEWARGCCSLARSHWLLHQQHERLASCSSRITTVASHHSSWWFFVPSLTIVCTLLWQCCYESLLVMLSYLADNARNKQ
jgi:hypothetical protein